MASLALFNLIKLTKDRYVIRNIASKFMKANLAQSIDIDLNLLQVYVETSKRESILAQFEKMVRSLDAYNPSYSLNVDKNLRENVKQMISVPLLLQLIESGKSLENTDPGMLKLLYTTPGCRSVFLKVWAMVNLEDIDLHFMYTQRDNRYYIDELKNDRDAALIVVSKKGKNIGRLSDTLQHDAQIVTKAIHNGASLLQISDDVLNDNLIEFAVQQNIENLRYVNASRLNKNLVLAALVQDPELYKYLPVQMRDDDDILRNAVTLEPTLFQYAGASRFYKPTVLAMIRLGASIVHTSETLQDDREVVLLAVNRDGFQLLYASPRLQDDEEVVSTAISNYPSSIHFASPRLQEEFSFSDAREMSDIDSDLDLSETNPERL